ncbi:MAG: ComF family protein [Deltaproteobacteria bacterium]|nr:ComF family protein [Deltaproteobacteria bacterium]
MDMIQQYKYNGKSHLAAIFGPLLASFAANWLKDLTSPLVIPVPLHPKRLRERGFNQSLLLARPVKDALSADLDVFCLRRTRPTRPQTGLKSHQRRRNLRGAFGVVKKKAVKGRNVILVDDVSTTGTTLNECARVLKRAGADQVFGLVLAKTATGRKDPTRPPNPVLYTSSPD